MNKLFTIKTKKRLSAFLMATLMSVIVFTGCTSSIDKLESEDNSDINGGKFSQQTNDGAALTDDVEIKVSDVISAKSRIVFDINDDVYEGIYDNSQAFDTNQYYFRLTKDNGTKYGSTFTGTLDENYQQTVFCSAAGCTHTDSTCPAYIDMIGDYFTLKGKLYFYSPSAYEFTTDIYDGEGARIRILEVAADGKNLFAELPGYIQTYGTVVTDGTYLYLTAQQERDRDIYIVQINMETGGVRVLYKMPPQLNLSEYRICDITADGKQLIFTARVFNNIEDCKIGVYSIQDSSFAIVKSLPADEYKITTEKGLIGCYSLIGNYLYQFDMETGNLTRQRIDTEETEIVIENLRSVTDNPDHITMRYSYGNKVVLSCFAGSKHKLSTAWYYVLDTDSQTVIPLEIEAYNHMGITSLIRIFSATPDYFVVATNVSDYNDMANEMALISKADFYASKSKFIPIGIIGA